MPSAENVLWWQRSLFDQNFSNVARGTGSLLINGFGYLRSGSTTRLGQDVADERLLAFRKAPGKVN